MRARYLTLFSLSGLVLALDQLTKLLAARSFRGAPSWDIIPGLFGLGYHANTGLAFGFLQNSPPSLRNVFFIGIPVFALILIVLIFIKLRDNQMGMSVALSLILSGAVGNLVDRLQFGYVVEFLELQIGLPPFNLADVAIVAGVTLMIYNTVRTPQL